MGEGGGSKENTADRRSGIAGVSGVSGRRFDSRRGSFFFAFCPKNALSGKNAYTGVYCITGVILYNKAYLALGRGPGASGLPAFFRVCVIGC